MIDDDRFGLGGIRGPLSIEFQSKRIGRGLVDGDLHVWSAEVDLKEIQQGGEEAENDNRDHQAAGELGRSGGHRCKTGGVSDLEWGVRV